MPPPDALLLAAVREAPRRFRLPPLPPDVETAAASGPETALAFAIEAARTARHQGRAAPAGLRDLFTRSLAALIRGAFATQGGDPAFQALVLRQRDAEVDEYVRLAARSVADRRAVRTAVDAVAHPGKLRSVAAGALRDALLHLHDLAAARSWPAVDDEIRRLIGEQGVPDGPLRAALDAVLASDALLRLARGDALLQREAVQQYLALCGQRGPAAGSAAATLQGRASARTGEAGEQATVQAFHAIAGLLDRFAPQAGGFHVLRSLRTPRGFPGEVVKAKEEWDAAIVRGAAPAEILLLAEVKASPAAAAPDFSRLHRGLQRLAHASAGASYVFASASGEARVSGESLRQLQPHGRALPPHVIYCCSAPPEAHPPLLTAASKAVLLAEAASVAFAGKLARDTASGHEQLAPVWEALTTAPRLRSALHQDQTSRAVREAMLHPQDLLAALAAQAGTAPMA